MVDYSTVEGYAVLLGRYAVVATVIGGGYLLLRKSKHPLPSQNKQANMSGEARQSGKTKKHRNEILLGSSDKADIPREYSDKKRKKKNKAVKPSVDNDEQTPIHLHVEDSNEDDHDNKEFARQLQNAKSGSILPVKNQGGSRIKSVKQSRVNNLNGTEKISNENSLASGADGDDDLSAANSPVLEATTLQPLRHGDFSDMLEAPAAGASVLRITEPVVSSHPKKERKPAKLEKEETQKQRQNRKKAELRKALREEEEKDRLRRLQMQLRTAREAEGRPAKDGRTFMVAAASQNVSAWAAPLTSNNKNLASNTGPELLDTYEPTSDRASDIAGIGHGDWQTTLPSEEEQLRLLQEETSWNTVISKKGKKKAGQAEVGDGKGEGGEDAKPATLESVGSSLAKSEGTLIVGDPNIDMTGLMYNGKPADALLNDGEQDFAFSMAQTEDEWEVA